MLIRHQVKLVLLTKYSLLPNPGRTILERITQVRCFFVFALGVTCRSQLAQCMEGRDTQLAHWAMPSQILQLT